MKKRILSILLTICMVLMLCPVTAFAANGDATALQNLLNGGGTVTLSKDYTIDTTLSVKNTVTLDLNGHVIKMTGSGSVISIAWSNLTLQDSSPTATHTDASLPAGGVITGGNAAYGGGVYVGSGGSMTMNGGTIKKCSAECGGGVYVGNGGSMTMNGGTIANCTATTSDYTYGGGGVYVGNGGSMTMNGGTIENCSSKTSGGGVFSTSNFSMSGNAIIRGCSAKAGGGVRTDKSSMTMNGGTIEACTSTNGTSDAVTISFASLLANGGIVKGTVTFGSRSAINTTSTDSCTKFYNEVTNNGTISGGVYYGGIQNDSSGTVSDPYHTVTFDTNGGSSVPTQWFVNTDKAPALQPADPTRENSVFMGWYNGDAKYDFTQSVTSDMTLTAKWVTTNVSTEAELKEALNAGATSIKLVSDINLSSTLDLTDKNITLDLNGHVLTGNIQLADSSASPDSILTLIDSNPTATHADSSLPAGGVVKGNITLTRGSGSVSHLYANGGTVTGQTSLPSYAGGIFCTSDTPTAFTGYVGNYGEIHGGIFYAGINESCIKENTVTFMNGDSRYALEVVASGNKVVAPVSTPLKAGYDFVGWYNGDTKYEFNQTITSDITLTAQWTPDTYTVTLHLNDGTIANGKDVTEYTYGTGATLPTADDITRAGHTFEGWYEDENFSGSPVTEISATDTGKKEFYAKWTLNTYTVTFDSQGGSKVDSQTVSHGGTVTEPTAPTYEGYTFGGWYTEAGCTTEYDFTTAVTESLTLYAKWTLNTYTVTFDANGGTGSMADVTGISGEYTLPANGFTAPEGKQFKAWSVNGSEKAVGDKITVTANTTVTAVWEAIEYNVTVTGGTASVGASTPITKATMGTTVTLTAGAAPSGQMFDKWVVNGVVVADANSATTTFTMPANNVTAQATYKDIPVVTYTVSFDANGGSGTMTPATGVSGDYVLPVCGFTAPNGKQFKAWSVGGVEKDAGATITVNANTTVTAVWENIPVTYYTVTFDSNGGSAVTAQTIEAGQKATKPADPTKAGYDFKGWTLNGSAYDFNSAVNGDITLVATWEQQQVVPMVYTVTFDSNGGSAVTAQNIEAGQKATKPADPTKSGYDFKGWTLNGSAYDFNTAVNGDITLVATWEQQQVVPTTYTVSFVANGGTGTMADVTGISGEYTLPANGFTAPDGKQFKAWSVGGVEKAVGDKITVTANTTVTAVWEDIPVTYYTVTFNSNGGSAVAEQTVVAGQKAVKPADPVKNGYIFKGWKLDGSTYDFNTAVNKNITLVAVWEEDNSFMDDWYWALIMLHSQKFDITATASEGGEITPAGVTKVQYSKNITYTITPDAGYAIKAVFVDGKDVGAVSEYTFKNVTKKHTIHALFEQINPYTDVKAGDWFYDDVLYVTAIGLMEGTGNGKFSPEITTDRAMLVTVLWRLEGCPVVDSPVDFFDVADGLWYSDAIDWASAYGIVNGYGDGRFGPTDQITREQIAAILNRYAVYKGWTDGTALPLTAQYKHSEWAENNVIWAENNGLLDGLGVDVSDMTAKASRAELAAYLAKFYKEFAEN